MAPPARKNAGTSAGSARTAALLRMPCPAGHHAHAARPGTAKAQAAARRMRSSRALADCKLAIENCKLQNGPDRLRSGPVARDPWIAASVGDESIFILQ